MPKYLWLDPYYVEFTDRAPMCLEGEEADVRKRADEAGKVVRMRILPYPTEPRPGPKSDCPSFCYRPLDCAGKTACPQWYACSE